MAGAHRKPPTMGQRMAVVGVTTAVLAAFGGGTAAGVLINSGPGGTATPAPRPTPCATPSAQLAPPASPSARASGPARAASPHPRATRKPVAKPPTRPAPVLRLSIAGSVSWISVTANGVTLFRGLANPGQVLSFNAPLITMVIGNAGAVLYSVHGGRPVSAGGPGQVVVLTIRG